MKNFKVLIVGFGLIGKQRLAACLKLGIPSQNVYCVDPCIDKEVALQNSEFAGVYFVDDIADVINQEFTHAVVAVPHKESIQIIESLLSKQVNVLAEKPMGTNLEQADQLHSHPQIHLLSVGFNYRFMPAIIELKGLIASGKLGSISGIKMELGHGGAPKDRDSWKLDPELAGGGVILDPGIHLVDLLVYLFAANPTDCLIAGKTTWSGFWNTGIEESANIVGKIHGIPFHISSSVVAWRTRFEIEVMGTEGYFEIHGRGRSDGPQKSIFGSRWGWLNHPSQVESESRKIMAEKDESLFEETKAWLNSDSRVCNANEALIGMQIYDAIMNGL